MVRAGRADGAGSRHCPSAALRAASLRQLGGGGGLPPLRLTAPAPAGLPNGPGSALGCLRLALLLVTDELGRYIVMIQGPGDHLEGLHVEVAGLPVERARRLLADLGQLRAELSVYRGRLLDVSLDAMGGVVLAFAGPPAVSRPDVVLPAASCRGPSGTHSRWPVTGMRCWLPAST